MTENKPQNQPETSADNSSIANSFNNAGGTITGSTINITNIVGLPDDGKRSLLTEAEISRQHFEPETILIPEGPFWMGSDASEFSLDDFEIGKHPVTNLQYKAYVDEVGNPEILTTRTMEWTNVWDFPESENDLPVKGVTWFQAHKYCLWLKEKTRRNYSLPNEAQWEKACRAGVIELYQIPEWTCTLWGINYLVPDKEYIYPWKDDQKIKRYWSHVEANSQIRRVVRKHSSKDGETDLLCNKRNGELPNCWIAGIGFRVVLQ